MFKMFSMTLLGLLALSTARAQSSQPIQAKIPFDFTVQNTTLEAGNYQLTYNPVARVLSIRGLEQNSVGSFANFVPAEDHQSSSGTARLVFECYDKSCYLAQVWQGAVRGDRGLKVLQTPRAAALAFTTRLASVTIPAK